MDEEILISNDGGSVYIEDGFYSLIDLNRYIDYLNLCKKRAEQLARDMKIGNL